MLAIAGAGTSAPATAQIGDAFDGVPGVTVVRYDVTGTDADAIRADIVAKGPVDPNRPGQSFGGATDVAFHWRWPIRHGVRRAMRCDLAAATIRFSATVTLPRLSGDATPALMAAWDRYVAALARHEATHVRYAYDRRGEIMSAIRRATCATADAAATRVLDDIIAGERAIDTATRHGAGEDISFP